MSVALAVVLFVLTILYCLLILQYKSWFDRLQEFIPRDDGDFLHKFSIIIPARNEAENIERCILSIYQNDYPAFFFEVIVADDFSDDDTAGIIKKLQQQFSTLRVISLREFVDTPLNSYKKKGIELAIRQASFEWVITTDADCTVPVNWLKQFSAYLRSGDFVFVGAPVKYKHTGSLLSLFQSVDFISLQGISVASVSSGFHSMCNGANLAYNKTAFYAVNGFAGVDHIASGDDMLLMHKMKEKYPLAVGYLFSRDVTVTTMPMQSWGGFFNQRIRWASKATSYADKKIFFVLLLVYAFNFCLALTGVAALFIPQLVFFFITALLLKIGCELLFMIPVARFFRSESILWWFPLMQPFHIFYTIISGWLGKFGTYHWKGRKVK